MEDGKNLYEAPVTEIIYFDTKDIITTSGVDTPFEPFELDALGLGGN